MITYNKEVINMAKKIILLIILVSFVVGIYLYPQMPDQMASHWNSQGEVDGYLPKCWGLFLMPLVSLIVFLLFLLIPKIDPLKKNIEKFRSYFDGFILLLVVFLLYVHSLSITWNLGRQFDMGQAIIPAMAILLFVIGIVLKKAKRNWFLGIRTPWTLSSDKVWDKTHQLASKLFMISAIIALVGSVFPKYSLWFLLIPVIASSLYAIIYSYFEYQKLKK